MSQQAGDIAIGETGNPSGERLGSVATNPPLTEVIERSDELWLILPVDGVEKGWNKLGSLPCNGLKGPIIAISLTDRRQLQEVTHRNHLNATEGTIRLPNLTTMEVEVVEHTTRQHRDFINQNRICLTDTIEGRPTRREHITFQISEELDEGLPSLWTDADARPAIDRHGTEHEARLVEEGIL